MTPERRYFARIQFRNRILEANGQRYQDLFIDVMTKRCNGFRPIKPHGTFGDEGNDGHISNCGRYYQVYAPENPKENIINAINKAEKDFKRLKEKWSETALIEEYLFVFNDKFQGAYPKIEHTLAKIKRDNGLKVCEPFLAKDLVNEFMNLNEDDMIAVLGGVIPRTEYLQDIDYAILTEILQYIMDNSESLTINIKLQSPDFDKKIQFNCISKSVDSLLRTGSFQQGTIENYFVKNSNFTRADIRDRLAAIYDKVKNEIMKFKINDIERGDHVFFVILDDIVQNKKRAVQDAAIALMAFFFETCDIFEEPPDE